uniref:Uncharacterized protein n=1 Tax=Myoviridae sp. cte0t5 TaxID=2823549 RepID=A0A8S5LGS8_9CAUD|nr:MAG TPA: hypothetical protein [Myoviridae sp. cte0t5]
MYAPIQKVEGGGYVWIIGGSSHPLPYRSLREHRETLWVGGGRLRSGPACQACLSIP